MALSTYLGPNRLTVDRELRMQPQGDGPVRTPPAVGVFVHVLVVWARSQLQFLRFHSSQPQARRQERESISVAEFVSECVMPDCPSVSW